MQRARLVRALVPPIVALGLAACGSSLPAPPKGSPPRAAFVEVPSPPPPARPELVPAHPPGRAVWVDGSWEWTGARWRWKEGGWFEPPAAGIVYTDWQSSRPAEERLLFASAGWRDRTGAEVPGPRLLASATMSSDDEADGGAAR